MFIGQVDGLSCSLICYSYVSLYVNIANTCTLCLCIYRVQNFHGLEIQYSKGFFVSGMYR